MTKTYDQYKDGKFSYSFLKNFALSPKHALAYINREFKETPAFTFGRLFHAVMADQVNQEFIIWNDMDRPELERTMASAKNKSWKRELIEQAMDSNRSLISMDEWAVAQQMRESVEKNPLGRRLLKANGEVELSYENDIFQGRADKVIHDQKLIIDWKSTMRLNPDYITYDIQKYHYDSQAAIYNKIIGDSNYSVLLVFIEKSEPYDLLPVLIEPDSETMRNGSAKLGIWYNQAKAAFENNEWGGVSSLFPDNIMYCE